MSEGTRVILRTMNGPPGKDGEVTLERLATELEPYAKQSDLLAEATRVDNLVQGQGTLLDLVNNGRLSPGGVATAARAATTRGTLPSETDLNTLDTLGGADEAGAWLMSGSYTYGNEPPRTPGAAAVLEVVVANAYTGIIQRVTEASGATWARNKVSTGAGAWTTWRRMDPHVDTTVGTRVFVGDVMVYGDTGWRDITSTATDALDPSNTGAIHLKREGSTVSLALLGVSLLPGDGPLVMGPLWQGFLPATNCFLSSVASASSPGSYEANDFIVVSQYLWVARRQLDTGAVSQTRTSDPIIGAITYTTSQPWPSTLPGTPA